jgi:hypothetical protein
MPAKFENVQITPEFLASFPDAYFVYEDDLQRQRNDGAAAYRMHPKAIGFSTMKAPPNVKNSAFKPEEYSKPFFEQLKQLSAHIKNNPNNKFYIPKLGYGAANRYYIWELLVHHNLMSEFENCDNVVFCWEPETFVSK